MFLAASGGEGGGEADQYNLLAFEEIGGGDVIDGVADNLLFQ